MIALLVALAHAHGGEDHGAAAPGPLIGDGGLRLAVTSRQTDAVLHIADPHVGSTQGTLLLADWATSAPLAGPAPRFDLSGPASLSPTWAAAGPGAWTSPLTFTAPGSYAGALIVEGPPADLLALSDLAIAPPHSSPAAPANTLPLVGVGLLALLVGFGLGRWRRAAGVLGALLVVGVAHGHGGEDHGPPAAAPPGDGALRLPLDAQFLVGLRTALSVIAPIAPKVQGIGHFVGRPGSIATLRAPVPGLLQAADRGFPLPGAAVQAGDVLGLLAEIPIGADRAALSRERADALTAVARARSELDLATRDMEQSASLGAAISDRERLERAGALAVAREALAQAEAAAAALGKGGPTWPLRAPLSGRLAHIDARPGDQVEPGDPLFRIVDGAATLWVEVRVPEAAALHLVAGARAQVVAGALPALVLPAVVLDAGQEADPATGQLTLTLAVEGGDPDIRPGMSATAWIDAGPQAPALLVPESALVDSDNTPLVFEKTGPETFSLRPVRAGPRVGDQRVIEAGLAPGARVVVAATASLRSQAGR